MALGNDFGLGQIAAASPNDYQIHQQRAMQSSMVGAAKDISVQERIAHVLDNVLRAHGTLDLLENGPEKPSQAQSPAFGLIGAAIECEQQSERLAQRLYSLQAKLGAL